MKMTVEKQLYVCVDDEPNALMLIDDIESCVNANMSGDRQIMVSVESLDGGIKDGDISPEFIPFATEILEEARKQECCDINIYC